MQVHTHVINACHRAIAVAACVAALRDSGATLECLEGRDLLGLASLRDD